MKSKVSALLVESFFRQQKISYTSWRPSDKPAVALPPWRAAMWLPSRRDRNAVA